MKDLARNPFFALSLALATLLAFQVYGIVSAQYKAPTAAPTGGMPAAPLHTGTDPQTKTGALTVGGTLATNGIFTVGQIGSPAVVIDNVARRITFQDGNSSGKIYLSNAAGGELFIQHGANAPVKIGTGSGGDSFWKKDGDTTNIIYEGGNVFIKGNTVQQTVTRYYYTYTRGPVELVIPETSPDYQRAPCDSNPYAEEKECGASFTLYVDDFAPGSTFPEHMYDEYRVGKDCDFLRAASRLIPRAYAQEGCAAKYRRYDRGARQSETITAGSRVIGGILGVDGSASFAGGKVSISSSGIFSEGALSVNKTAYIGNSASIRDIYLGDAAEVGSGHKGISITGTQTFLITGGCRQSGAECAAGTTFGNMGGERGGCQSGFTRRDLGVIYLCTFP